MPPGKFYRIIYTYKKKVIFPIQTTFHFSWNLAPKNTENENSSIKIIYLPCEPQNFIYQISKLKHFNMIIISIFYFFGIILLHLCLFHHNNHYSV